MSEPAGPSPDLLVRISASLWEAFVQDAQKDGLDARDALERALSAYIAVREGQREGALFLLLAPDGTLERLAFDQGV